MTEATYIEWAGLGRRGLAEHPNNQELTGGFLCVQRDGAIVVTVYDDYYSGVISRPDALRLLEALKEVLEEVM